ncbi:hypothetical protein [Pseudonocardia acaciae]|uniref:hypothetical protein n=1 Tax=Pseudonocardia acaciae TaxID=551276 RepID=UPI00048F9842|nr:hypothetical protein [Pseudonocardia acaciae]
MRTRSILLWPFALAWGLVRLMFWPALVLGVAWLFTYFGLLPSGLFALLVVLDGLWALWSLRLWAAVVKGSMRSMERGTVTIRNQVPRRRGRARRRRVRR